MCLRQSSSEYTFYAPIRLPGGSSRVVEAGLRHGEERGRRIVRWSAWGRAGKIAEGELDLPALTFGQALSHVERALADAGIEVGDTARE